MTPFEAIQYVGTPIALVAFIVATGAYLYRARLVSRRELIETAPETERARLLDATIRDFTTVPTETLTREQRYQLALRLIEERAAKFRTTALVGVLVAVILAGVVVIVTLRYAADGAAPASLIVRVHGPGGRQDFLTSGTVTLDVGSDLDTRPIGPDGQVRFDNIPRQQLAGDVVLIPRVAGYAPASETTLTGVEEGGVVYIAMAPKPTRVYGTVIDPDHAPVADVVLIFDGGSTTDTTAADGTFSVTLQRPPGTRVPIRALKDGIVGYNDTMTIPDNAALTVPFVAVGS